MPTVCSSADAPKAARKLLIRLIGAGIQRSLSPAMHECEARSPGLCLQARLRAAGRPAHRAAVPGRRTCGRGVPN